MARVARGRVVYADPPIDEEALDDDMNEKIRRMTYEDISAMSDEIDYSALDAKPLPEEIAKQLRNDTKGRPKVGLGEDADVPAFMGSWDGRDDDLNAPWRQEAEALVSRTASEVGVEIEDVMWDYGKLRLTVPPESTSGDINRATRAIVKALEAVDERLRVLDRYELEVTSPGTSEVLTKQRDFETFKGFQVTVDTDNPIDPDQKRTLEGKLVERNAIDLVINQKGRMIRIPYHLVLEVKLVPAKTED